VLDAAREGQNAQANTAQVAAAAPACTPPQRTGTPPASLHEASGVAASRRYPGVLWTHNDSGSPAVLFAIDSPGTILGELRVAGARTRDWKDNSLLPCPAADRNYLADPGDNKLRREQVVIYRFPEPAPGDTVTGPVERFPLSYPDGPRDVEALYTLPDGALYLVSKGRRHPIELFRYPPPLREGENVVVEQLQRLSDSKAALPFRVTGAGASPDGRWVALRTYSGVQLYRPSPEGRLVPALPAPGLSLEALVEPQGEAVDIRADGTLILVSEAGPKGVPGVVGEMRCQLP
jgi:hypothetical protein